MSSYVYTRDIPDADDNPSDDQPDMKINTNSIDSIIGEDHYSFGQQTPDNAAANGFHKQVRLPNLPGIPGSLINQSTTIYSKFSNNSGQIFMTNGVSGNEYQMSRTNNNDYSTFGGMYSITPTDTTNLRGINAGWSFIAGKEIAAIPTGNENGALIVQYGYAQVKPVTAAKDIFINFPVSFSAATSFSVQITVLTDSASQLTYKIALRTVQTTGFTVRASNIADNSLIYFHAIGF